MKSGIETLGDIEKKGDLSTNCCCPNSEIFCVQIISQPCNCQWRTIVIDEAVSMEDQKQFLNEWIRRQNILLFEILDSLNETWVHLEGVVHVPSLVTLDYKFLTRKFLKRTG